VRLVIDASVAVKWLVPEELQEEALSLVNDEDQLIVPEFLFAEVGNILWKKVRREEMEMSDARDILLGLRDFDLEIHPLGNLVEAALEIGNTHDTTVYDGIYLALAIQEKAILVTADRKFFRKIDNEELASSIQLLVARQESEGDPDHETG
jgi:predicted nucleic acid-binding protein